MVISKLLVIRSFQLAYNVRVYETLVNQGIYLSSYTKVTKRTDLRKPAASNGLYTLLEAGLCFVIVLLSIIYYLLIVTIEALRFQKIRFSGWQKKLADRQAILQFLV